MDPLCHALLRALADETGGHAVVRRAAPSEQAPPRETSIGVYLQIDTMDDNGLIGRLDWQIGTSGARQVGPTVQIDVMDAPLSDVIIERFAQGLLQSTPELQLELARFTGN